MPSGPAPALLTVAGDGPWAPQRTRDAQVVPGSGNQAACGLPHVHLQTIRYLG